MNTKINLRDESFAQLLRERYGLSRRELEVAQSFAEGKCCKRQAIDGGLSPHTIRAQSKGLYKATKVHGQLQVVALIHQIYFEWAASQKVAA